MPMERALAKSEIKDGTPRYSKKNKHEREQFDKDLRKEFEMSPWTSGEADWLLKMTIKRDWVKVILQPLAIERLAEQVHQRHRRDRARVQHQGAPSELETPDDDDFGAEAAQEGKGAEEAYWPEGGAQPDASSTASSRVRANGENSGKLDKN